MASVSWFGWCGEDVRDVAAYLPHGFVFHVNSEFVGFAYVTADGRAPRTTYSDPHRRFPAVVVPAGGHVRKAAAAAAHVLTYSRLRSGYCVRLEFYPNEIAGDVRIATCVCEVQAYYR